MNEICQSKFFKNKKVLVMGLGLHGGGVSVIKWLYKQGAKITVTDMKTKKQLASSLRKLKDLKGVVYHLGAHKKSDFKNCDIIIKGPGVPIESLYLDIARKNNIPILSDIGIFLSVLEAINSDTSELNLVAITGTKGKSTTVALIREVLKQKYPRVFSAGNNRKSVLEILPKIKKGDWVVLELSSFQLEDIKNLKFRFSIAVLTSLFPDHLNRHKTFSNYKNIKKIIFKHQNTGDILIVNKDSENAKKLVSDAKSRNIIYIKENDFSKNAAKAVGENLNVPKTKIKKAIKNFRGLPGRLEKISEKNGIVFINNTTATNSISASFGLDKTRKKFPKKNYPLLALIAGGSDKKLPMEIFVKKFKKCDFVVFLPGEASDKMIKKIKKMRFKINYRKSKTMKEAVVSAYDFLKNQNKKAVILLSPGAASFGVFNHEFDRGDKFNAAVKNLPKK